MSKIKSNQKFLLYALTGLSLTQNVMADPLDEQCLLNLAVNGDDAMTLAEMRSQCSPSIVTEKEEEVDISTGAITRRAKGERLAEGNRFVITPHRPNYILPMSYNSSPNKAPYDNYPVDLSNTEIKFQISLKAPVWEGVFNGYGNLYVAYTNTSWWQAYNSAESAPFRETNHEPEMFMMFPANYSLFGLELKAYGLGFSHQSNGRSNQVSRSWNRAYAQFLFEKDQFYMAFKPWLRLSEDKKDENAPGYPNVKGDDNPDIEKYLGNGELYFGYKYGRQNVAVMLRNNLRSDNLGAVQLDWSFPLNDRFRGYIQYFNGYGESLIDYNSSTNRFSVGVMLTDWL